ncbi:MAG TPA: TlpA disulfide reductase family protein [Longimicrobiales bacterium]|nr:TlpA disulfide reductase family protein [Longimicrobiales bacterium]
MAAVRRNWWIRITVLGLAGVLAALIWINREQFVPVESRATVPDYSMLTLAGEPRSISHYRGDPILLNVWATWCPPCVREMPALQRLHEALAPEGVRVVAVSVDAPEGRVNGWGRAGGNVERFVAQHELTFEILRDPSGDIETAYGLVGLPTTFLIDRDGRIRERVIGWREWDRPEVIDQVRELLED